jgi:hypothetical protein
MTVREYKPNLLIYYRNSKGDTIPAVLISLCGNRLKGKGRVRIEGDFLYGPKRRVVMLKNCEPQSAVW